MFTDLSAFPLTPLCDDEVDEVAFAGLIERLASAGVNSITALGSTGAAPYLTSDERRRVARIALRHAGGIPVIVGVSALRTSRVIELARDAADAGAAGLLLAPMSYQPLTDDDVFGLYEDLTAAVPLPVIVYDNPGTTHFRFSDALYAASPSCRVSPRSRSPGCRLSRATRARIEEIRSAVPDRVTIGISGDASAARSQRRMRRLVLRHWRHDPRVRPHHLSGRPIRRCRRRGRRGGPAADLSGTCSPSTAASELSPPSRTSAAW